MLTSAEELLHCYVRLYKVVVAKVGSHLKLAKLQDDYLSADMGYHKQLNNADQAMPLMSDWTQCYLLQWARFRSSESSYYCANNPNMAHNRCYSARPKIYEVVSLSIRPAILADAK